MTTESMIIFFVTLCDSMSNLVVSSSYNILVYWGDSLTLGLIEPHYFITSSMYLEYNLHLGTENHNVEY